MRVDSVLTEKYTHSKSTTASLNKINCFSSKHSESVLVE